MSGCIEGVGSAETTVPESIDPEMIRNGMERSVQNIKELAESDFESPS